MPASKSIKLNTGAEMPTLGLGTWRSQPGAVEHAVEYALKNGYRNIDTATAYGNESEVGQGIKKSGVPREEIFLTTKLNNPDMGRPKEALEYSLKQLDTPYLDLWLMHWPAPMTKEGGADKSIDWLDTWHEMEKLYKAHPEKIKAIGVSNFSVEYLKRLLSNSEVVPAANQIELHPSCPQQEVIDLCVSKGIAVTGYSPLGSEGAPLLKNPTVVKIAEKYGVKPGTILISLQANRPNVNVLPKSVTNERILANATIIDLEPADVVELNQIAKTEPFRACHPSWAGWGNLGFTESV
ncbi:NADP-dependent oxidoreductase domain-containing protein [Lentinula edodes]|uniref:NADP-dependent oxidoreductase domain-containing protein n=1 Tax=Lentinula lateritia TaxID=40482 RepID=A0A9W9AJL8_9AGAR|nr:NADP-dependent oxidoreductase domain-containing protein [Lentinula novae-zelandiae]KAJ3875128.1 NADP-dependent oxidoreductase domain-containing protein [Lentinula edodes]KAJ3904768.1 NADP-dependent oxidoreductase domain-containing protein [Lentinula edodes]KAJ3929309.1 MAG: NADP-dependent oxidoreductase domain-containing protein [Lentinula lateritia]KAJ4484356.1 NADP-dependent oxidoreductase domain-containing protein [Lentinula edodes]